MELWNYAQTYLLYLLALAFHEAGHCLTASLLGYRWKGIVVGPLKVSREDGPMRVGYSRDWLMGFAIPFPSPNNTCAKQAVYIAAGPVASLLLAVVIGISMRTMVLGQQNPPWQATALFLISIFLFVGSIIPCTSKYHKGLNSQKPLQNDGAMLVELWRERKEWTAYFAQCEEYKARGTTYEAELARYNEESTRYQAEQEAYQAELATYHAEIARYEAVNALHACAESGMRPRDWDAATVNRATILQDGKANELAACCATTAITGPRTGMTRRLVDATSRVRLNCVGCYLMLIKQRSFSMVLIMPASDRATATSPAV